MSTHRRTQSIRPINGFSPNEWMKIGLIFLATLLIYLPALHGDYLWDDDLYITENPAVASADGLAKIWLDPLASPSPYPLVFTTYWLEYRLWGASAFGYHAVNVILHGVNSILLGVVLRRLAIPGAFFASAIFAFHPVHVESVAWIAERKDVLSGLFYFLSILSWLNFLDSPRGRHYFLALLFFFASVLSKTVTCTLPVVLLFLAWQRRPEAWRRRFVLLAPFFAATMALGLTTAWWERHRFGGGLGDISLSIFHRGLIAGRTPWFYAAKLFWPSSLTAIYPQWNLAANSPLQWLFPAGLAFGLVWLAVKRRSMKEALLASLFFLVTLAPALGFVNFTTMNFTFVADHFQYLASCGWIAFFAFASVELVGRMGAVHGWIQRTAMIAILAAMFFQSWNQAAKFENEITLFSDTLAKNPKAWLAYNNIGRQWMKQGRFEEATSYFAKAAEVKAQSVSEKREDQSMAEIYTNQGLSLAGGGRKQDAIKSFEKAIAVKPDFFDALANLGSAYLDLGRSVEAIPYLERAVQSDPNRFEGQVNLGLAYMNGGRLDEAIQHLERSVSISPESADALELLGSALIRAGNGNEGKSRLKQAQFLREERQR